jgi:hypothetical protein
MRDPATRADPDVEAIEDTRRLLEPYVQDASWKADPDGFACDMRATIQEVEESNLADWAMNLAVWALFEQTKKRRSKPTRSYRDMALQLAAARLVARGYMPTAMKRLAIGNRRVALSARRLT